MIGAELLSQGKESIANKIFQKSAELSTNKRKVYLDLARKYENLQMNVEAKEYYRKIQDFEEGDFESNVLGSNENLSAESDKVIIVINYIGGSTSKSV